ncbi:MAG TPA: ACP S-malonyltransferase [Patescibacteria group bacterium]|jgi:[acyl-carrier-protein] S-malonyltransferase|nr:ACP S-malonyltransferase [Patescibacteria group bacterium]
MNVAFLFPGQGSQHVGMGQSLYEAVPAARAVFDQADVQLGFPLSELCFFGPEESLTDTVNQQPALFVTSLAGWEAMQVKGDWPAPDYVAGHSLGEISALVAAGSINFSDGLTLVRRRGELMKEAGQQSPGAMAAILALDYERVEEYCAQAQEATGRPVQVANDNCPGQVVISGDKVALDEAMKLAMDGGARRAVPLPITIAAHSPLMSSSAKEFALAVDDTLIHEPRIRVIGNVSAKPLTTPSEIRSELKAQLTAPVLWKSSINYLLDQGVDTFLEVGPGEILLGLVKRINRNVNRIKFELSE